MMTSDARKGRNNARKRLREQQMRLGALLIFDLTTGDLDYLARHIGNLVSKVERDFSARLVKEQP